MTKGNVIIFSFLLLFSCSSQQKLVEKPSQERVIDVHSETPNNIRNRNFTPKEQQEIDALFIDASSYFITEDYQRAFQTYMDVLQIAPNNAAACFQIAKIYIMQNRNLDAEVYAAKAARLQPQNIDYLYQYSVLLVYNGKTSQALKYFDKIIDLKPQNESVYLNIANVYAQLKQPKDVIRIYDTLETKYGIQPDYSLPKTSLYMQIGNKEKAKNEIYKLLTTMSVNTVDYWMTYLYLNPLTGDTNIITEVFKKIDEIDPDYGLIKYEKFIYYAQHKNYDEAKKMLMSFMSSNQVSYEEKAEKFEFIIKSITEDTAHINNQIALLYLDTLQKLYPDEYAANKFIAEYYHSFSQDSLAAVYYKNAIDIDGRNYMDWSSMIECYWSMQNWDKMSEYALECSAVFPELPLSYYYLGISKLMLKDEKDALLYLETGLSLVSKEDVKLQLAFYSLLGDLYYKLDNRKKAYECYETVITVEPNNASVLNNYAYYLALEGKDLPKAAAMSLKTVQREPTNPVYLDTYAWILFLQKKYQSALDMIEMSIKYLENPSAVYYEHYGDILWFINEKTQAAYYWRQAEDIRTDDDEVSKNLPQKAQTGELF
jgi:tetratricopeptide (TPR) repeat protein